MTKADEDLRPTTLICTVGGSPAPIRSALAALHPDRVIFVVSDGKDGVPSSRGLVENERLKGHDGGDAGPGLKFSHSCPSDVTIYPVPADDPDRAFGLLETLIDHERKAGRDVVADYTGGTKSMSSALLIAGTAAAGVRVQFMQGVRSDLVQVEDGTERPTVPPVHLMTLARDLQAVRAFMVRRDYGAAFVLLEETQKDIAKRGGKKKLGIPKSWMDRLSHWREWVRFLDLWDRFEHRQAWRALDNASGRLPDFVEAAGLTERLQVLAEAAGRPSAALVEDLWLNAERRAAQGRFDDAIARCYRLMEAAVQARLWERHRLDTSRLRPEETPDGLADGGDRQRDPKTGVEFVRLGLVKAKMLLAHRNGNDELVAAWGTDTPGWVGKRNQSILAHGFSALGEEAWEKQVSPWFEIRRQALWENLLERSTAPQLPDFVP